MIRNYRQLIVWQKSIALAERIYPLARALPDEERFGLSFQLRKCAVSIPSNIAEGHTRRSTKDYLRFLSIALGSVAEAETQLLLAVRLGMLVPEQTTPAEILLNEVGKMLRAIQAKLEAGLVAEEAAEYSTTSQPLTPDP